MNSAPFFSVIINCHNSEAFLKDALASVFDQTFTDYEIIILDNASNDNTANIAKSYDNKIRYYFSDQKLSLGKARNHAITHAKGHFLAFLDSDDTWLPDKLNKQYNAINNTEEGTNTGICWCNAMRVDQNLSPLIEYSLGRNHSEENLLAGLIRDCIISMSSCAVNREVCISLGGFNDDFEIIEEWDLWIRIGLEYRLVYVDEILANIRFHESNTSKNYKLHFQEVSRMLTSFEKDKKITLKDAKETRSWFKLRYLIVDISHCWKINKLYFPLSILKFLWFSLLNIKIILLMSRYYLNPSLLKFFLLKYF